MASEPMQAISRAARSEFDALKRRLQVAERRAEAAEARTQEAPDAEAALRAILDRLDAMADRLDRLERGRKKADVGAAIAVAKNPITPIDRAHMLYGVKAIAEFLGVRPRQALHMIESGRLPHYNVGRAICANRSTLTAWLSTQEGR